MTYLLDWQNSDNINVDLGNTVVDAPVLGDSGYLRSYEEITTDRTLQLNRSYAVNGLARLNLVLPDASNGDRVILYVASLAGFRVSTTARIQHDQYVTAINGYVDSMIKGTHVLFEKSTVNWLMSIFTGYCNIV